MEGGGGLDLLLPGRVVSLHGVKVHRHLLQRGGRDLQRPGAVHRELVRLGVLPVHHALVALPDQFVAGRHAGPRGQRQHEGLGAGLHVEVDGGRSCREQREEFDLWNCGDFRE